MTLDLQISSIRLVDSQQAAPHSVTSWFENQEFAGSHPRGCAVADPSRRAAAIATWLWTEQANPVDDAAIRCAR